MCERFFPLKPCAVWYTIMFLLAHPCLSLVVREPFTDCMWCCFIYLFIFFLYVCSVVVSRSFSLHSLSPDTQLHMIENVLLLGCKVWHACSGIT